MLMGRGRTFEVMTLRTIVGISCLIYCKIQDKTSAKCDIKGGGGEGLPSVRLMSLRIHVHDV